MINLIPLLPVISTLDSLKKSYPDIIDNIAASAKLSRAELFSVGTPVLVFFLTLLLNHILSSRKRSKVRSQYKENLDLLMMDINNGFISQLNETEVNSAPDYPLIFYPQLKVLKFVNNPILFEAYFSGIRPLFGTKQHLESFNKVISNIADIQALQELNNRISNNIEDINDNFYPLWNSHEELRITLISVNPQLLEREKADIVVYFLVDLLETLGRTSPELLLKKAQEEINNIKKVQSNFVKERSDELISVLGIDLARKLLMELHVLLSSYIYRYDRVIEYYASMKTIWQQIKEGGVSISLHKDRMKNKFHLHG
ncbi:hypothetical protein [Mucilaginibacter sp. HD30]